MLFPPLPFPSHFVLQSSCLALSSAEVLPFEPNRGGAITYAAYLYRSCYRRLAGPDGSISRFPLAFAVFAGKSETTLPLTVPNIGGGLS